MFQKFKKFNLGIWLLALGLTGSLNLFVLSLPGIGRGIWPQSEFAVTGLHVFSALCAVGLFIIGQKHKKFIISTLLHPLVLLPFLIALLSLSLSPFHDLPIRNLLGAPQSGEGVVWWVDWSILSASALVLWRFKMWRLVLGVVAFLSFIITFGLTLAHMHFGFRITPYSFPDFLAFNLFCLVPLATSLLQTQKRVIWAGLCILFYIALYLTANQIAFAFGFVGVPFFIALWFLFRKKEKIKIGLTYLTIAVLPFVALGSIYALIHLMGGDGFYDFSDLKHFKNIVSRGYMMEIGLQPLIENPMMFLTGTGWGSFTEHVVQYLPTGWFDFTQEGTRQWEGVSWDQFHTHDMFVDILFSTGLLGLLLFYGYFLLIPASVKSSQKWVSSIFSAFMVSVVSFWFLFPINVPAIALAIGAIGKNVTLVKLPRNLSSKILWVMPAIVVIQIMAANMQLQTVRATHRYDPKTLSVSEANYDCPMEYYDAGAGGLHLARLLVARIRMLIYMAESEVANLDEINKNILKLNHLYCQSTEYVQNNAVSNRLLVARLLVPGEVLLGVESLDEETIQFYMQDWKSGLKYWLKKIPARTDQAVPFLLWHLLHEKESEVKEIASLIYSQDFDDPVGLWFTGLSFMAAPETAQKGLFRMRKALRNGIERHMPIEDSIKEQLLL